MFIIIIITIIIIIIIIKSRRTQTFTAFTTSYASAGVRMSVLHFAVELNLTTGKQTLLFVHCAQLDMSETKNHFRK